MDRLIYTAMTGAHAASQRQAVLANNLANVSTNGFRAEMASFRAVPVEGDGASTRVFAHETTVGYLDRPGHVQRTDRPLDAMAKDNAWFAVQAFDGTEAYTRNGALDVATDGTVVNTNGMPVLSDGGGTITVPPNAKLSLGRDGTISSKEDGQPATPIGRLKLVRPSDETPIKRSSDGLFRSASGEPLPSDTTAQIEPGAVESSNVNAIETMVAMIQVGRQYEVQMKLLQHAEGNDKTASRLIGSMG